MARGQQTICEQIKNVRSNLDKAEQSFDCDQGLRGELDLMLAEAEMKHLQEKRKTVSFWNRQKLALFTAMALLLTGGGGWLWAKSTTPQAVAAGVVVGQVTVKTPEQVVQPQVSSVAVDTVNEMPDPAANLNEPQPAQPQEQLSSVATPQESPASLTELRTLVRVGRKTLNSERY
ncbi:MAG: hypothetical protein RR321_06240 [Acidaminococcaceae bacterium]